MNQNESDTPETDGVEESLWLRYKQAEDITPEDNARELLRESLFFARRLKVERDQLRAQLAQRDEALKVARETIMELCVQLEHVESLRLNDFAPTPATLTPNILATGRAALRRIEELTKEKTTT